MYSVLSHFLGSACESKGQPNPLGRNILSSQEGCVTGVCNGNKGGPSRLALTSLLTYNKMCFVFTGH